MSTLTYKYRIKDSTHRKHLTRMGWAANRVWNYCNEVSMFALRRDKRWLSAYDLNKLTAGCSKALGLHAQTIQAICEEYVKQRRQHRKRRLSWRSRKRSLGWIPFKASAIKLIEDALTYLGRIFRLWLSRPLAGPVKTGCFSQDARGRWYICLQCDVPDDSQLNLTLDPIGIDLGLQDQIACSDGITYSRENLTRHYEDDLAMAQRAGKQKRTAAIHAKIKNARRDWTHKATTAIVKRSPFLYLGDVSSTQLAQTRFAKSTYDAGWGMTRAQLTYKANRLAGFCALTREHFSSVTCSGCLERTGPSGLSGLEVRVWTCSACGSVHDRDTNAALNILRTGRRTPIKGILGLQAEEDVNS